MSSRRLMWAGVIAAALVAVVIVAWPQGDPSPAERTRELTSELRCPDCEGLSVLESSTASARETRRDVAARVRRGESDGEIRRAYVDAFGESILLKPRGDGLGLVVWALPIIAVLAGVAGLALALRRWQSQPRLTATAADEEYVARHREESGS